MKSLLLASAFTLGLSAVAFAQEAAPAAPQAQASVAAQASFSDDEVKKVAALAADVKALNATHQPKISAAADATAKAAAQKDLDTAIQGSLAKNGLTVDRYNEIARAAQADQALAARIAAAASASTGVQSPSSATEPSRQ